MTAYSVLLFAVAAVFFGLSEALRRGHIGCIHEYHWKKVREEERPAYARAFARGLRGIACSLLLSGGVALAGETKALAVASVLMLFLGMAASFRYLIRVQKRYHGGLF